MLESCAADVIIIVLGGRQMRRTCRPGQGTTITLELCAAVVAVVALTRLRSSVGTHMSAWTGHNIHTGVLRGCCGHRSACGD